MAQPNPAQPRRRTELARALAQTGPALPGTLPERHTRRGKPNCRCKHNPPTLHGPYYQGTRKIDGKTLPRWHSPQEHERDQDWFAAAQRARALFREIETAQPDHRRDNRRMGSSTTCAGAPHPPHPMCELRG